MKNSLYLTGIALTLISLSVSTSNPMAQPESPEVAKQNITMLKTAVNRIRAMLQSREDNAAEHVRAAQNAMDKVLEDINEQESSNAGTNDSAPHFTPEEIKNGLLTADHKLQQLEQDEKALRYSIQQATSDAVELSKNIDEFKKEINNAQKLKDAQTALDSARDIEQRSQQELDQVLETKQRLQAGSVSAAMKTPPLPVQATSSLFTAKNTAIVAALILCTIGTYYFYKWYVKGQNQKTIKPLSKPAVAFKNGRN